MNCIMCKNCLEPEPDRYGKREKFTLLGITEVNPAWEVYTCRVCSHHNRFIDEVEK